MGLLGFECPYLPPLEIKGVPVAAGSSLKFKLTNLDLQLDITDRVVK